MGVGIEAIIEFGGSKKEKLEAIVGDQLQIQFAGIVGEVGLIIHAIDL